MGVTPGSVTIGSNFRPVIVSGTPVNEMVHRLAASAAVTSQTAMSWSPSGSVPVKQAAPLNVCPCSGVSLGSTSALQLTAARTGADMAGMPATNCAISEHATRTACQRLTRDIYGPHRNTVRQPEPVRIITRPPEWANCGRRLTASRRSGPGR